MTEPLKLTIYVNKTLVCDQHKVPSYLCRKGHSSTNSTFHLNIHDEEEKKDFLVILDLILKGKNSEYFMMNYVPPEKRKRYNKYFRYFIKNCPNLNANILSFYQRYISQLDYDKFLQKHQQIFETSIMIQDAIDNLNPTNINEVINLIQRESIYVVFKEQLQYSSKEEYAYTICSMILPALISNWKNISSLCTLIEKLSEQWHNTPKNDTTLNNNDNSESCNHFDNVNENNELNSKNNDFREAAKRILFGTMSVNVPNGGSNHKHCYRQFQAIAILTKRGFFKPDEFEKQIQWQCINCEDFDLFQQVRKMLEDNNIENLLSGVSKNELNSIIRNDDIDAFLNYIAHESSTNPDGFDPNQLVVTTCEDQNLLAANIDSYYDILKGVDIACYAAYFGAVKIFKRIWSDEKYSFNSEQVEVNGITSAQYLNAFHYAIAGNCPEIIHLVKSKIGTFPESSLDVAIFFHRNDIFEWLWENQEWDDIARRTAVMVAGWSNNLKIIRFFLNHHLPINDAYYDSHNSFTTYNTSLVLLAAESWCDIIIALLIDVKCSSYVNFTVFQDDPKDGANYHVLTSLSYIGSEFIFRKILKAISYIEARDVADIFDCAWLYGYTKIVDIITSSPHLCQQLKKKLKWFSFREKENPIPAFYQKVPGCEFSKEFLYNAKYSKSKELKSWVNENLRQKNLPSLEDQNLSFELDSSD
ncbi:hypothetical protein TRFO_15920 [Tritrichomonas foetus]|uniref:DUF3447 domain-containing protein n=1 Tax=Tritrichomonas foetus TaxID=1144522 RepID=A0A1J4KW09_9EUKA|nr:hypothetical protein TRFO_15920 [Tritrichomonas foetus]|eukprot:OHT13886.1 hypothetical protein TRFO_15920 [Tritrichomonas foetus]